MPGKKWSLVDPQNSYGKTVLLLQLEMGKRELPWVSQLLSSIELNVVMTQGVATPP